jgi:hypothetical protein
MGKINMETVIIIIVALVVGTGGFLLSKKNDGPVEQMAEAVLRAEGIDIDLSPEDKDKKEDK